MKNDLIHSLKEGKISSFIIRSWIWPGPIRSRSIALYGLFKGVFSFKEFFGFLLPAKYRNRNLNLGLASFINTQTREAIRDFVAEDNSVELFDNKFYMPFNSVTEMFDLIYQVIFLDQYNAKKLIKDGDFIIDAGANIGTFSILAASLSLAGSVYSFEPVKSTFDILRKNTESYPNIHCYNLGLGDKNIIKNIFTYNGVTGGSVMEDSDMFKQRYSREDFTGSEEVSIVTIDDFVERNKIAKVDFIKIDTEGYEKQILTGAKETIRRFKPIIVASAYHSKGDKKSIPNLVHSLCSGYKYRMEKIFEEDIVFYYDSKN